MTDDELEHAADVIAKRIAPRLAAGVLEGIVHQCRAAVDEMKADIARWKARLTCAPRARHARRHGYTYLVQVMGIRGAPIKIGRTIDLEDRLGDLQRMSAYPLRLAGVVHGAKFEELLHAMYRSNRIHGEWFCGEDVQGFVDHISHGGSACWGCQR